MRLLTLLPFLTLPTPSLTLTTTPSTLLRDLTRLESTRTIKNLQRTYASLAQYGRWAQISTLFLPTGTLKWGTGTTPNLLSDADAQIVTGPASIESWLRANAGSMDGIVPGSLHAHLVDMPVITLSADGKSAKGRWVSVRYLGDGGGGTRIEGGIFENTYKMDGTGTWKIEVLRYFPLYSGDYEHGWKNVGVNGTVPVIPYHYTPDEAGMPVLLPTQEPDDERVNVEDLERRIDALNDEDEVRNLVHSMGYYVDQRLWGEVVDLFAADGTITFNGTTSPPGAAGLRSALGHQGPEGLSRGVLNEHPIFGTIVQVDPSGKTALARGLELGMIGDYEAKKAQWQFCVFRHTLVKDPVTHIWKIQNLNYTRLNFADYATGWGSGGISPAAAGSPVPPPPFLDVLLPRPPSPAHRNTSGADLSDLARRLARSAAVDETENVSAAYGFYIDDIRCPLFAQLHASQGFKMSPGVGWYRTPERIERACTSRYGNNTASLSPPPRASVPLHWRLQPVTLVSQDGRSVTLRTRNLQTGTARGAGGNSWNGGMYHDQLVLEDLGNGQLRRKLWCLTIDEFYWTSRNWSTGWAAVERQSLPLGRRQGSIGGLVADAGLREPAMIERETGFNGGPTPVVSWPNILRMWFAYRNPVSGKVPESYWPWCVPCRGDKASWLLTANRFQEPATGPTLVTAVVDDSGSNVTVTVSGGPEELVTGMVEVRAEGADTAELVRVMAKAEVREGKASISVPPTINGVSRLVVSYAGSDHLSPGRTVIDLKRAG